ncbi:hypothetical protein OPV22_005851 [Ensete ventricosum]|uniref:Secreted protein n=1 Tax=Ensete ventricosum TaxID=4639 RepID=A0AAV8RQ29_ENSVE|nr:hypothetical protein OPV22_005851 [Ensete ventricosum]
MSKLMKHIGTLRLPLSLPTVATANWVVETASFVQLDNSRRVLAARGGEMSASSKGSDWPFSSRWVQIDGVRRVAATARPTLVGKVDSRGHKSSTLEIKKGREPMV